MLALHYFLRSESSLDIIYKNIDHYLMDNGYVIFTFMDGKKVFDFLKTKKLKKMNLIFGDLKK